MPRATNPDSTIVIVLDCDKDQNPQAKFLFRPPVMADEEKLGSAFDIRDKDSTTLTESVTQAIETCLIGFENCGGFEFGKNRISEFLSAAEGFELVSKLLSSGRLDSDEKKSSESPASSEAV